MEEKHPRRGGLVWPVILIGAGVVFLLNNLGLVAWNVWGTLLSLWPVLLIAIGLDILVGRRSAWGSLVVAVLLLAILAGALWLGVPQWGGSQVERTETIQQPLQGAESASVEIGFGAGSLRVGALQEGSPDLIQGRADLSRGERVELDFSTSGSKARLNVRSQGTWSSWLPPAGGDGKTWDLELNRDIPIALKVKNGVGRTTLDLARLDLTRLDVGGGVGQVSVTLPARGRFDVNIDGGVGEVTIVIPQGLAARIRTNGGLGGVTVNGEFQRRDREYISRDYAIAENRVDVNLDGGVGRLVVRSAVE